VWRHNVQSIQCDAAHIPLASGSVDLIVCSPPYFALRDYKQDGESLKGQVGNEPTPREFLESLWQCTGEWMRVLKPRGSIFVNLGDKWAGGGGQWVHPSNTNLNGGRGAISNGGANYGFRNKSLLGLPWRYAIGCTDQLGLILREEIIWTKANGMPESVKDRCRRSHEQFFHFTKQGDYYSAIDRIREDHAGSGKGKSWAKRKAMGEPGRYGDSGEGASGGMVGGLEANPRGKLPPSVWDAPVTWPGILAALPPELAAEVAESMSLPGDVWDIPTYPLNVPKYLEEESLDGTSFEFDHFAAYPPELVQKIILGWSPKDVCARCGQGRFPVTVSEYVQTQATNNRGKMAEGRTRDDLEQGRLRPVSQIIGNACACTPYTDHPERRGKDWRGSDSGDRLATGQRMGKDFQGAGPNGHPSRLGGEWHLGDGSWRDEYGRGKVREYHLDQWEPAPSVPGVVLDPFGGTGTTAITAAKLSRRGITCDLSYDYAKRLVDWRMYDLSQNRRK
jgi:DNA modification methylase